MNQTESQKPLTITISEEVVEHVTRFAENSGKKGSNLRVAVKGGGCSGMTYILDIVDEPKEEEVEFPEDTAVSAEVEQTPEKEDDKAA